MVTKLSTIRAQMLSGISLRCVTLFLLYFFVVGNTGMAQSVNAAELQSATHYSNARYGFSLSWLPGKYAVREAANGDGVTVQDDRGFMLLAYGTHSYMVMGQNMHDAMAEFSQGLEVTYKRVNTKHGWFVLSGFKGDSIVYVKCFFGKDVAHIVHMTYPKQAASTYAPQVEKVVQTFVLHSTVQISE